MALMTSSNIPPATQLFFDRLLLMRSVPFLVFGRIASRKSLKQREGTGIKFRRIEALPLATTPLAEGVPPQARTLTYTDIQVSLGQWGDVVSVTDFAEVTNQNSVLQGATEVLGEQAGQTTDALLRDVACGGTAVLYGGAATQRSDLTTTTHKVSTALLDRILRVLRNANAKPFTSMIKATSQVATTPIRPAYWAIVDPDIEFTLQTLTGFIPTEQYPGASMEPVEGEVGAYKGLRFLSTTQNKILLSGGGSVSGDVKSEDTSNADVHMITAFGREAIAFVPLEGMSLRNIMKRAGSGGTSDPLDQQATSGWKHTGARVRLNEAFMVRAEVTVGKVAP